MPLDLTKKQIVDLSKTVQVELTHRGVDTKANVKVILDISGSMEDDYLDGTVQTVLSKTLALAIALDANEAVDLALFGSKYYNMGEVTIDKVDGYIKREVMSRHRISEGTNYSVALEAVLQSAPSTSPGGISKFFSKKTETPKIPDFVLFFTDGQTLNEEGCRKLIRELSKRAVFVQFIGIGKREAFKFLEELNELDGCLIDAAGFMKVGDISSISGEELNSRLLNEFPDWIPKARNAGVLAA